MNVSNVVQEPGIRTYIIIMFYIRTLYSYNFALYLAGIFTYFRRSGLKLSIHYYMMAFIIVWYLHVSYFPVKPYIKGFYCINYSLCTITKLFPTQYELS